MKSEDFIKRLDDISHYDGIPYGRILLLSEEEEKHKKATIRYTGYHALSGAFKCHVLETVELFNTECLPKINASMSEFYKLFLPRLFQNFLTICGAERVAIFGYPYQGYTLLRNVFDNLVLLSAALQNKRVKSTFDHCC